MTPDQCLGARELLGWSRARLAGRAGCSDAAIRFFETGQHKGILPTYQSIRTALEAAGVEFIGGDAPGVCLRRKAE